MAITCPTCGAQFDATLFQFGHRVRCDCGTEVEYPGANEQLGHVAKEVEDIRPHETADPGSQPDKAV
jgi:hypothetical protein